MALWLDKHRPKKLQSLDYHREQAGYLEKLVAAPDFPHLLISGPPGSGKKTRVMCLLRELYGNGVDRLRKEQQTIETPSKKKHHLTQDNKAIYHLEAFVAKFMYLYLKFVEETMGDW